MIKHYLQLVRIPGIFTAFSNILFGFFLVQDGISDFSLLIPLLSASGFLFMSGMIFNDYFDYNIDKKERPFRPLPSKSISKKFALFLGIAFVIIANVSSLSVGLQTLFVSLILTVLILSYDIGLKKINVLGIIVISLIRIFNVILGTTTVSLNFDILYFVIPIGIYVVGLGFLAKNETSISSKTTYIMNIIFILTTFSYTIILIVNEFNSYSILFLGLFFISIFIPYLRNRENTPQAVQKIITFQLLAIILLDATLTSIVSDVLVSFAIVLLYLPAYLLTKKIYFT